MRNESIKHIVNVIGNWKGDRTYTYEIRSVRPLNSPIVNGESILIFTSTLYGFYCEKDGKELEISLTSKPFHTTTLSNSPLSDNPKADKYRLEKFLDEFDAAFEKLREDKLAECGNKSYTTDPLCW